MKEWNNFYWSDDAIKYLQKIKFDLEEKLSARAAQVAFSTCKKNPVMTEKDIKEFAGGVLDELKKEL